MIKTPRRWAALATSVAGSAALLGATAATAAGPTVTTLPIDKTLLTDSYALLSGIVNPNGLPVVYSFQYGPTTKYGKTTPVTSASNGKADVPVDVSLDDLKPATTYHFRLIADVKGGSNDALYSGDYAGVDQTFKTSPALKVKFASSKASVTSGKVGVKLSLTGPSDEDARGRLTLRFKTGKHSHSSSSAAYHLTVGAKAKTIKVTLTHKQKAALKAADNETLKVSASAKTSGIKKAVAETLTVTG